MAKNDVVLIDRIIEKIEGENIGEKFENFAIDQILKDYELSEEDLSFGNVDGENDGGIDGIFFFVNNHLITDINDVINLNYNIDYEVYIITCKHEESFKLVPVNNIATTLDEFFDLTIDSKNFISKYNEELISKRELFCNIYYQIAHYIRNFNIKIIYSSRGDENGVAINIKAKANYVEATIKSKFSLCNVDFSFYGSGELLKQYRKQKKLSSEIKCVDIVSYDNSYILMINLKEYYNFIVDEETKLKRYFLDSNVRAYMGDNRVNLDIKNSLEKKRKIDFWFLNNGITILSSKVTTMGKKVFIDDVQIVNGLQTTETIYNHFLLNQKMEDDRNILVKVIVSDNKELRDDVIRSTNNQTNVEMYSLRATDKIQRDIEEIMLAEELYYERRTNYYLNQGIDKEKIVAPLYLAYGWVTLILKIPYKASRLKSKFMTNQKQYDAVFSSQAPISIWPTITKIMKKTDKILEKNRSKFTSNFSNLKYLKNMRALVMFLAISKLIGKFNFTTNDLLSFNIDQYDDTTIANTIMYIYKKNPELKNLIRKNTSLNICKVFANDNNISDFETIKERKNVFIEERQFELTEEFIDQVQNLLPKQPWPSGTHSRIAKKLNVYTPKVSAAIKELVKRGICYHQNAGNIYDKDNNLIMEENK